MSDEDDDNVYDGRQHFGRRYLEPRELVDYAKALRPDLSWLHVDVLEALERERLVVPVLRVRLPLPVARVFYGVEIGSPNYDASLDVAAPGSPEVVAADAMLRGLELWDVPAHAPATYPLDDVAAPFGHFFEDPAATPFSQWDTFRCPIGKHDDGSPLYRDGYAVKTYYHYWQAFVFAEAAGMRWTIYFNALDPKLREAIQANDIKTVKESAYLYQTTGGRTLHTLLLHTACFNATAWDQMFGARARWIAHGTDVLLTGTRLDALRAEQRRISHEAVVRFSVSPSDLLVFMRMLANLWVEAKGKERRRLARHYRHCFSAAYRLYERVTGHDYDTIVCDVGPFDGHPEPVIKVLFPDWRQDTERHVLATVTSCNREWTNASHGDLKLTDQDAPDLVAWLVQQNLLAVSWRVKHANAVWRDTSEVGLAGLAKEVEGLAANLEQIVGGIVKEWGLYKIFKKLWTPSASSLVHTELVRHKGLERTTTAPFPNQLAEVERLAASGAITSVTAMLFRATLVRNHGAHVGLSKEEPQNLWDYFRWLVMVLSLAWKQARDRGLLPKPLATP